MHSLLQDHICIYTHKVTWGEMDAFNHVNNTVYFRYFENARIKHFEDLNFMEYMKRGGIGPILAETSCRFKAPVTYPDTVHVGLKVEELTANEFSQFYTVVSEKMNCVVAEGRGRVVCFDYANSRRADFPTELYQQLDEERA